MIISISKKETITYERTYQSSQTKPSNCMQSKVDCFSKLIQHWNHLKRSWNKSSPSHLRWLKHNRGSSPIAEWMRGTLVCDNFPLGLYLSVVTWYESSSSMTQDRDYLSASNWCQITNCEIPNPALQTMRHLSYLPASISLS
jgi:hypothetical protein